MKTHLLFFSCCAIVALAGCAAGQVAPRCGDGVNDPGEQCDDGNTTAGDGCSAACQIEPPNLCPAPSTVCSDVCTNTATDQANCGLCGRVCPAGEGCNAGVCRPTCQTGLVDCEGTCVEPNTNRAFCGAGADCVANPGVACADGEICDGAGVCALSCQLGLVDCSGTCVDPSSNPTYCGATTCVDDATDGVVCALREVCVAGTCTPTVTRNFLFVSDNAGATEIPAALLAEGHLVTSVFSDFVGGSNATLVGSLSQYDAVFWHAVGTGFGDLHNAATFVNLSAYVSAGGAVFVTGYDVVASPSDPQLFTFLGGTSSTDATGGSGGAINTGVNSLTDGFANIEGLTFTAPNFDHDNINGVTIEVTVVVPGTGGGAEWSVRTLGAGEAAWVSSGQSGTTAMPAWTMPNSRYHEALLNFAANR